MTSDHKQDTSEREQDIRRKFGIKYRGHGMNLRGLIDLKSKNILDKMSKRSELSIEIPYELRKKRKKIVKRLTNEKHERKSLMSLAKHENSSRSRNNNENDQSDKTHYSFSLHVDNEEVKAKNEKIDPGNCTEKTAVDDFSVNSVNKSFFLASSVITDVGKCNNSNIKQETPRNNQKSFDSVMTTPKNLNSPFQRSFIKKENNFYNSQSLEDTSSTKNLSPIFSSNVNKNRKMFSSFNLLTSEKVSKSFSMLSKSNLVKSTKAAKDFLDELGWNVSFPNLKPIPTIVIKDKNIILNRSHNSSFLETNSLRKVNLQDSNGMLLASAMSSNLAQWRHQLSKVVK